MTLSRNLLCQRLRAIGISKHNSRQMVNDVLKWTARNGPEWTVKRLKDAKAFYLSKLANKDPEMATWWAMTGPKGNRRYKSVWLNLPQDTEMQLVRAICACNAYTMFRKTDSVKPTKLQHSKFYSSVEQERSSVRSHREAVDILRRLQTMSGAQRSKATALCLMNNQRKLKAYKPSETSEEQKLNCLRSPRPFWDYSYSETKRAPMAGPRRKEPEDQFHWVVDNVTNPAVMGLLYKYKGLASAAGFTKVRNQIPISSMSMDSASGGTIGYIQEDGYKLRAVANPYRMHQVVLQPLKQAAGQFLEKLVTDCTHDQSAGQDWAQQKLVEGRTLHAVDLSDATNNIPLGPQLYTLVTALKLDLYDKTTSDLLNYFVEVSRGDWQVPFEDRKTTWTWGQPMGLGPSFFVFAIWHNYTLRLAHALGGSEIPWHDAYRIVGDDVVIACDSTHEQYRKLLASWQIPVSESKCISSNKCTEFVGKVVTPTRSYPIPKFKSLSDRNFLDVLKTLGPQAISWCKPRQKLVAKILMQVPEEFGGLGWNPKGLGLDVRTALAADLGLLESKTEELPTRHLPQAVATALHRAAVHGGIDLCTTSLRRAAEKRPNPLGTTSTKVLETSRFGEAIREQILLAQLAETSVDSDKNPLYMESSDYQLGAPLSKGDPRGKSQLEAVEQRLKTGLIAGAIRLEEDPELETLIEKFRSSTEPTSKDRGLPEQSHASNRKSVKRPKP